MFFLHPFLALILNLIIMNLLSDNLFVSASRLMRNQIFFFMLCTLRGWAKDILTYTTSKRTWDRSTFYYTNRFKITFCPYVCPSIQLQFLRCLIHWRVSKNERYWKWSGDFFDHFPCNAFLWKVIIWIIASRGVM